MLEALRRQRGHRKGGFTIIEVMIVLAIAGLIMLIVLIAIPQLQRNQRNTSRKSIIGRIKTEIDAYSGNNNGTVPTTAAELAGFNTRYLTGVNINDPTSGAPLNPTSTGATSTAGAAVSRLDYRTGYICNNEAIAAGSARNYVMFTQLEGGAIFCLDNR